MIKACQSSQQEKYWNSHTYTILIQRLGAVKACSFHQMHRRLNGDCWLTMIYHCCQWNILIQTMGININSEKELSKMNVFLLNCKRNFLFRQYICGCVEDMQVSIELPGDYTSSDDGTQDTWLSPKYYHYGDTKLCHWKASKLYVF